MASSSVIFFAISVHVCCPTTVISLKNLIVLLYIASETEQLKFTSVDILCKMCVHVKGNTCCWTGFVIINAIALWLNMLQLKPKIPHTSFPSVCVHDTTQLYHFWVRANQFVIEEIRIACKSLSSIWQVRSPTKKIQLRCRRKHRAGVLRSNGLAGYALSLPFCPRSRRPRPFHIFRRPLGALAAFPAICAHVREGPATVPRSRWNALHDCCCHYGSGPCSPRLPYTRGRGPPRSSVIWTSINSGMNFLGPIVMSLESIPMHAASGNSEPIAAYGLWLYGCEPLQTDIYAWQAKPAVSECGVVSWTWRGSL